MANCGTCDLRDLSTVGTGTRNDVLIGSEFCLIECKCVYLTGTASQGWLGLATHPYLPNLAYLPFHYFRLSLTKLAEPQLYSILLFPFLALKHQSTYFPT